MNPAALMADLQRLEPGGTVIINEDAFEERNLEKAGYKANPLDDDTLSNYRVLRVPMTSLTKEICAPLGVKPRDAERSKNFFALGLVSFMYTRPVDPTLDWIAEKFGGNELVEAANKASFLAGFNFGETTEAVGHRYEVKPAKLPTGEYTSITGNTALAWGIVAAGQLAKLPITLGSYPITPASDILHELSKHKHFGIRTVQAEDEIARDRHGPRRRVRRASRRDHHQRPRCRPQERDHLTRRVDRAAVAARRHPARWTVDRPADQDRGVRPQHRALRTPR
jgi:2-oxoglutarate/2-oxoacid ferredoxin oxidoreductase subunit alpha